MVSHETVRLSSLFKAPTSRLVPGCQNQGNPTPGGVSQRAPNKAYPFQVSNTQCIKSNLLTREVICRAVLFLMFLTVPTLGTSTKKPWEDEDCYYPTELKNPKEFRPPTKISFVNWLRLTSTSKENCVELVTMIQNEWMPEWKKHASDRLQNRYQAMISENTPDHVAHSQIAISLIGKFAEITFKSYWIYTDSKDWENKITKPTARGIAAFIKKNRQRIENAKGSIRRGSPGGGRAGRASAPPRSSHARRALRKRAKHAASNPRTLTSKTDEGNMIKTFTIDPIIIPRTQPADPSTPTDRSECPSLEEEHSGRSASSTPKTPQSTSTQTRSESPRALGDVFKFRDATWPKSATKPQTPSAAVRTIPQTPQSNNPASTKTEHKYLKDGYFNDGQCNVRNAEGKIVHTYGNGPYAHWHTNMDYGTYENRFRTGEEGLKNKKSGKKRGDFDDL